MFNKDNMYIYTRKELKNKAAMEFKEGDIVTCGKYRVWIRYGDFETPSMVTAVTTKNDLSNLAISKQPEYIRSFINRGMADIRKVEYLAKCDDCQNIDELLSIPKSSRNCSHCGAIIFVD